MIFIIGFLSGVSITLIAWALLNQKDIKDGTHSRV